MRGDRGHQHSDSPSNARGQIPISMRSPRDRGVQGTLSLEQTTMWMKSSVDRAYLTGGAEDGCCSTARPSP